MSISFGCPAIFLIGGGEQSVFPRAIILRDGDIVVMSRGARLCIHGIPRILPTTSEKQLNIDCKTKMQTSKDGSNLKPQMHICNEHTNLKTHFELSKNHRSHQNTNQRSRANLNNTQFNEDEDVLSTFTGRININIRQVYPDDIL